MITDYAMPGMTGLQLAEAARLLRPGPADPAGDGLCRPADAPRFDLPRLSKPYQQRQLAEQITHLLG